MKRWMRSTLGLAAVAALTACGGSGQGKSKVDVRALQQVAQGVARGEDRVNVKDLSHWIVQGRKDFVLIDIRKPDAFVAGHIQGAESVPLAELMSEDKIMGLPTERKLIVYSADSAEAAAATALLRLAGLDAVAMSGGYDAWDRQVLHPEIPTVATVAEAPANAEQRAIACYFLGGKGAANQAPVYAPKAAPAFVPPVSTAPPLRPRHANEGC
jgi:rhodanese-related sulfurtransferase